MDRKTRIWSAAIAIGAGAAMAVPALAAEVDPEDPLGAEQTPLNAAARAETAWERVRTAMAAADFGPYHPIVGRPDYGDSEAVFGASRSGHTHAGQDVFAPAGTPLVAVSEGAVVDVGTDGAQGNHLAIYDPKRDRTYVYMHLESAALVEADEHVEAGQRVGAVGCTGSCWGDHLHFEIRDGRDPMGDAHDPLPALKQWPQAPSPAH